MVANPKIEEKLLTEAEYALLGDEYEIIDGVPVERELMSNPAVFARDMMKKILDRIVDERQSGLLSGDGFIYLMWKTEKGIGGAFIPDISYIRRENLLPEWKIADNYPGVPDLAIEVVSEHDNAENLMIKVRGYLERGCEQVWVIYPVLQELHQYRRDGTQLAHLYRSGDRLDVSAFFPNVEIAIADIFKSPI
jgi:Uma2 family endonuclease